MPVLALAIPDPPRRGVHPDGLRIAITLDIHRAEDFLGAAPVALPSRRHCLQLSWAQRLGELVAQPREHGSGRVVTLGGDESLGSGAPEDRGIPPRLVRRLR